MNKATILIIDDEPQIRRLLEITLESNSYRPLTAENAREGIAMAASHMPDLVLLDIGLPDKNGHAVLKELCTWYQKPIIILSVENDEAGIVSALDNGAADYLVKPFRNAELLARIRSALRHNGAPQNSQVMECGNLRMDFAGRNVWKNEQLLKFTATEFNLLALLMQNEGRVLTHQFILKSVWGPGYQTETQYLRVFIGALRKKIEDRPEQPRHIITESGVGYRFQ